MKIEDYQTGRSYYQKRLRRYEDFGDAHELTFSCFRGYKFFSRDRTCEWFISALGAARNTHPFDLWAYVIMPEHIHVLVYPREPEIKLGIVFGEVKQYVGQKAVRYMKRHSPEWLPRITVYESKRKRHRFWQPGGGYDRNTAKDKTLRFMIDYIHANPVRRGLVERPEDWYWSSARWYAGLQPTPIEMDCTIPMYYYVD